MGVQPGEITCQQAADREDGGDDGVMHYTVNNYGGQSGTIALALCCILALAFAYVSFDLSGRIQALEVRPTITNLKIDVPIAPDATSQPTIDLHAPLLDAEPPARMRCCMDSWPTSCSWSDGDNRGGGAAFPRCAAAPVSPVSLHRNIARPGSSVSPGRAFRLSNAASSFVTACQPNEAAVLLWGRAAVARRPHKPQVAGSIPAPASGRNGRSGKCV